MYANTSHLHFCSTTVPQSKKCEIPLLRELMVSVLNCGICFLSVTLKKSGWEIVPLKKFFFDLDLNCEIVIQFI